MRAGIALLLLAFAPVVVQAAEAPPPAPRPAATALAMADAPPAALPAPALGAEELRGITGRAGSAGLRGEAVELPGVRLWDEWTPPAATPPREGHLTVNGVRVR
jgi:hypothetical protein